MKNGSGRYDYIFTLTFEPKIGERKEQRGKREKVVSMYGGNPYLGDFPRKNESFPYGQS